MYMLGSKTEKTTTKFCSKCKTATKLKIVFYLGGYFSWAFPPPPLGKNCFLERPMKTGKSKKKSLNRKFNIDILYKYNEF